MDELIDNILISMSNTSQKTSQKILLWKICQYTKSTAWYILQTPLRDWRKNYSWQQQLQDGAIWWTVYASSEGWFWLCRNACKYWRDTNHRILFASAVLILGLKARDKNYSKQGNSNTLCKSANIFFISELLGTHLESIMFRTLCFLQ